MGKHMALVIFLIFTLNTSASSQSISNTPMLSGVTLKAFSYFERIQNHQYDDFLRSIRTSGLTPELHARVMGMLPKTDLVNPDAEDLDKVKTLDHLLKYHERYSVIEIKVLRIRTATAVFLAGAAVLITEPALKILTADELQAIVAHELGHEYYWNRFEEARRNNDSSEVQELELRCDGIAVITLQHLGISPENLISAVNKLNKYNKQPSSPTYVAVDERVAFIQQMIELVSRKQPQLSRNTVRISQRTRDISVTIGPFFAQTKIKRTKWPMFG